MSIKGCPRPDGNRVLCIPRVVLRVPRLPRSLPLRDEDERGSQRVDGGLPQQLVGVGDSAEDHPEEVANILRGERKLNRTLSADEPERMNA